MNRSAIPPSAKTSASPIVATVRPTAPAAICRRAISTLLWVLACGRSATPRSRINAAIAAIRASVAVEVDDDRRRVDRRDGVGVEEGVGHGHLVGRRRSSFVGRYRSGRAGRAREGPERQEGVGDHDDLASQRASRSSRSREVDPVLWEAMLGERRRQHDKIELIASENYTSAAVMEAQGSWLTNKYAEGLPGKRYYGGCEYVDIAERLAQERALALFPGAEHVNVQPHSGAQANMAAYFSVLEPGDRIMGMNLAHGGHLTHGMALNFSGRLYEVHAYGVRQDTERIDYDAMAAQAREVRPKLIVGGASAYPRTWDFERMAAIAADVGAMLFIDMAHIAGLVAADVHPSPFPHADLVTTTTHKTLRGPRGGMIFARRTLPARARRRATSRRSRTARPTARWPPRSTGTSSRASRAVR